MQEMPFQRPKIQNVFFPGEYTSSPIEVIADDVLVYGLGDTQKQTETDHDRNLKGVLERARQ